MTAHHAVPAPGDTGRVPSIMGGPLHALGVQLGLVDTMRRSSVLLGLAIAGALWGGLVLLTIVTGKTSQVFTLSVIGGHVRLLVAIPLFFLCETLLDPLLRRFTAGLRDVGMVPASQAAHLDRAVARFNRGASSRLGELVCLLIAVAPIFMALDHAVPGSTAFSRDGTAGVVGDWYWFVCLPVFRFLLLRWVWRLALWNVFLWRLSKLELHLVATHPDRCAGLGYLAVVQGTFAPLLAAASSVLAATIAEEIIATGAPLGSFHGTLVVTILIYAAIFLLPLCAFVRQLLPTRVRALAEYMEFASSYVNAFEAKWMRGQPPTRELLGAPDLQSLADLTNSVRVVEEIRFAPIDRNLLASLVAGALMPMLPLMLFQIPVNEIAQRIFEMLFHG